MAHRPIHEANRLSWNAATRAHNRHKGDQAAALRAGQTTLYPEDFDLLGDLRGKRVLHMQCNAGQDTLSLAMLGATVTGVDISDEAIDFARTLSAESGLAATFHRADLLTWLHETAERFDVAYTSYGALCWLEDLRPWGQGIARVLRPGGRVVLLEFHPFAMVFDENLKPAYDYGTDGHALNWAEGVSDYVGERCAGWQPDASDPPFVNPHPCHEFSWGIGDIVTALLNAGLHIERLEEYAFSNGYQVYDSMVLREGKRWVMPEGQPKLPLMFGLTATRTGAD